MSSLRSECCVYTQKVLCKLLAETAMATEQTALGMKEMR